METLKNVTNLSREFHAIFTSNDAKRRRKKLKKFMRTPSAINLLKTLALLSGK
jgi:hypothetical protein